jgi:hypothetical protein
MRVKLVALAVVVMLTATGCPPRKATYDPCQSHQKGGGDNRPPTHCPQG